MLKKLGAPATTPAGAAQYRPQSAAHDVPGTAANQTLTARTVAAGMAGRITFRQACGPRTGIGPVAEWRRRSHARSSSLVRFQAGPPNFQPRTNAVGRAHTGFHPSILTGINDAPAAAPSVQLGRCIMQNRTTESPANGPRYDLRVDRGLGEELPQVARQQPAPRAMRAGRGRGHGAGPDDQSERPDGARQQEPGQSAPAVPVA